ncbi:MAG: energy transducer TonB [Gemmatimonadales bacterium]|nr:energy transducer TonB [Gemmatimonadales bacterium]MCW5777720.1 energy transducer TonB [Phycisphaeraceae bacterium]
MADFRVLPPSGRPWDMGATASFVLHALIVSPLLLPQNDVSTETSPFDQIVTFFVPPDRPAGAAGGGGVDWSGLVEHSGATEEPLAHAEPEETIALGPPGDLLNPLPTDLPPGALLEEETALTEIEVDSTVVRDPRSAAPVYPAELLAKNVEGTTFVNYVVDSTGRVDSLSIRVIQSSHPEFTNSVRNALALMSFRPAIQANRPVRQWVQQNFAFRIVPPTPAPPDSM